MIPTDSKYWSTIIFTLLVSTGVAVAVFVNRTTTDISDALAAEVLQQQSDVAMLVHEYDALVLVLESERLSESDAHSSDNVNYALEKVEGRLQIMRSVYSFERLDGAATAHAYVKPLIEDIKQWLTTGIPGVERGRDLIVNIAAPRLVDRYPGLRAIAKETNEIAQELVNTQTGYLDRFGKSLMFLVAAFSMLALGIAALLTRQRDLQFQISVDQQHHAQRIQDFADTGADWFWEMNPDMRLRILSGKSLAIPTALRNEAQALSQQVGSMPAFEHDVADDHWPINAIYERQAFNEFESELVTYDGSVQTISVSGKPLFNDKGKFEGYRGIGRDITARRAIETELESANRALIEAETRGRHNAEQALRDSEIFLRSSLNALPQNLAILDRNGIIVAVNTAWETYAFGDEVFGDEAITDKQGVDASQQLNLNSHARSDSGIGSHFREVFGRKSAEEKAVLQDVSVLVDRVVNGNTNVLRTEVQIIKPENNAWLSIALSPFESNSNRYVVLSIEEVTDQKLMESQDRQLRAELAHFSRLTTVGELATGLAHELNQPLTAISHNCDALMSGIGSHATFDQDDIDAVNEIHSEADRASAIIKGLRKLVRKETGGAVATDINSLVTETMRLSLPDASRHGIKVELNLAENLPQLVIDSVQIQQVLVNLERNGVEAIRNGKARLRQMRISTRETDNGFVKITVQDSGGGFTEEVRNNLFQPFLTTKKGGMGMGLSISRSIIESHGGQLWVDFDDPVMTTFSFTLPITNNNHTVV